MDWGAELLHRLITEAMALLWPRMGTTSYGYWLVPICGAAIGWFRSKDRLSMKALWNALIDALAAVVLIFVLVFSYEFYLSFAMLLNPQVPFPPAPLPPIPTLAGQVRRETRPLVNRSDSLLGIGLKIGYAYYINASGVLKLAEANAAFGTNSTVPAICVAESSTSCVYSGIVTTGTWKVGGVVYLSDSVPGGLTQIPPSTSGHSVQVIGHAVSTNRLLVAISPDVAGIQ